MSELAGLRVLVVEDEYLVALEMEEMVRDLGGTVVGPAGRLDRALRLVDEAEIDVAVIDLNMDGKSTMPLLELLGRRHIPFIIVTGYERGAVPQAMQPVAFLSKPVSPAGLKAAAAQLRAAQQG
jgi:CheY-like chemotaxis protein